MSGLQRLIITFKPEELVLHALYVRTQDGSEAAALTPKPAGRNFPLGWNLYLPRSSSPTARLVTTPPKRLIIQVQTCVPSRRSVMEVAHGEMVEAELNRLIEKCSTREMDPDERDELWQESVRAYNARGREENRAAWCEYHQEQAERHRAVEGHQDRCYHEPQLRGG